MMGAESDSYKADIVSAAVNGTKLITRENRIEGIALTAKQKTTISTVINYHDFCTMEVKVYGY